MKISARCQVLSRVVKTVFIIGAAWQVVVAPVVAQDAAKKEKKVKDQGEYDIFNAAGKETDPNKQLQLLQQWKEKYPDSDFKQERADTVAMAYDKLNKLPEAIDAIQEAMAINPKDLTALQLLAKIAGGVLRNNNPPPELLARGRPGVRHAALQHRQLLRCLGEARDGKRCRLVESEKRYRSNWRTRFRAM